MEEKLSRIKEFDPLQFRGKVNLKNPQHDFHILGEWLVCELEKRHTRTHTHTQSHTHTALNTFSFTSL